MTTSLNVVNLATATFECIYGRGCDGVCCREGEPPVGTDEAATIAAVLPRVLPLLRPDAQALIEAAGFLGEPHANGEPKLKVSDGWCVFFNKGCVLHQVGAADGDAFRYKPSACSLFPLYKGDDENWHVRQWGHDGEEWDLFCLDPKHSPKPAAETLGPELRLARRFEDDEASGVA
jgi:Fe-S-cluster containining protein